MSAHEPSPPPPTDQTRTPTCTPIGAPTGGSTAASAPAPRAPCPSVTGRWLWALVALAPFAPGTAAALEFECSLPDDTRYLRVDVPGEEHLCEVSVQGGRTGDARRVMWYADNETLFCSAKAYELRDKYVDTWSFDCTKTLDRDGIDRLSPRHRTILDAELLSLLDPASGSGESAFAVTGTRAATSSAAAGGPSLLALQFFFDDGTDLVRVVIDENGAARTFAESRDLAASVPTEDGFRITDAFVTAIDEAGTIDVTTRLERRGNPPCEGRSSLQASEDGTFVPVAPHRHVCADTPPAPGDAG